MAAAAHLTVNVYGTVQGAPPYGEGIGSPARVVNWDTPTTMSFPTTGTIFHPVDPGIRVGNSSNYIYSVVEVQATGTNVHGQKYSSDQSVATLATLAG